MSLVAGVIFSLIIKIELYESGNRIISSDNLNFYNLDITLHGLIMIFFVLMPGLFGGLGNYLVPIYVGSPEIIFPRLNNCSVVFTSLSLVIMLLALLTEYSIGPGWTVYPPLSLYPVNTTVLVILGLTVSGLGTLITSINYTLTAFHTLILADLFVPAMVITSIMLIFVLPVLTGALLLIISDMYFNTIFWKGIINGNSGDPVLYQHLFWFFGHPEVYILIIPAFGVINQVLSIITQSYIFGFKSMILAIISIATFGNLVWAHHMFTVGLEVETSIYFTIATLIIAVPTGTKLYNWLSMYTANLTPFINIILLFIVIFVSGGCTGLVLANNIIDLALHDTYYVVSHFHYILSIAAILGLIAGVVVYHNMYNVLNPITLLTLLVSWNITFFPLYFLGFNVMPRRIMDYPDYLNGWNYISSLGSVITVLTLLSILQ